MPQITFPDGTFIFWGDALPVAPVTPALPAAPVDPTPVQPVVDPVALTSSPDPVPTQSDVRSALAKWPPRVVATAARFLKVLGAAVAAGLAAYQGDVTALLHDPRAVLALAGAAVVSAGEKFIRSPDDAAPPPTVGSLQ